MRINKVNSQKLKVKRKKDEGRRKKDFTFCFLPFYIFKFLCNFSQNNTFIRYILLLSTLLSKPNSSKIRQKRCALRCFIGQEVIEKVCKNYAVFKCIF